MKQVRNDVTIATRGKTEASFGDKVKRIFLERTKEYSVREVLRGTHYDVVIDKIAYCSNDIKYVMDVVDAQLDLEQENCFFRCVVT